jgi:hypothetical protein
VAEIQIDPEPEPTEREVVTLALARLLTGERVPTAYLSPWRQAGIAENLTDD